MFDTAWDAGLDDAQLEAVTHGTAPLVVVAGAGTGKTRTLTARVAFLLERGVPAERILLLTFTRRAADEMVARAAALCHDRDAGRRLWGGTFHAVAYRVIAEHAAVLGLDQVSVIDPSDVSDLLDLLRDEHGLTTTSGGPRMPRSQTLADVYSRAVNTGRPARDVVATDFPWCEPHLDKITALLRDFVQRKRSGGLMDFDDLLLGWRALLGDPVVRERLIGRWDHVLVDEYQDVNAVQVDIVTALRPDGVGLTVVGDDAQAVYGFRGAHSGHLLSLSGTLPDARVIPLERNFRSRQPLLDLANVIRPADGGPRITLRADRTDADAAGGAPGGGGARRPVVVRCHDAGEEARLIADTALNAVELGGRLRDQVVLMRSGHHSDLLEVELATRRIPFVKYGGLKFLQTAHVKDFIAAVRLLGNRIDELAWFRLLRMHEGIGPARARALLPVVVAPEVPAGEVVAQAPARARTQLHATLTAITAARGAGAAGPRVRACVEMLRPLVRHRYADAAVRLGDIDRLAAAAAETEDLAAFVAALTLDPPASTGDYAKPPHLDEDYLTLSTVHSAKGLEWPTVHLMHAVDGAFPSDMALSTPEGLAEEQRLFYVAVTRARDDLMIYTPLRMPHHRYATDDRHSFAPACRFLDAAALATTEQRQTTRPATGFATQRAATGSTAPRVALPTLDALLG